jgi:hypothetical protein
MNRRGFLGSILAAAAAPAIVRAGVLMPVRQSIVVPPGFDSIAELLRVQNEILADMQFMQEVIVPAPCALGLGDTFTIAGINTLAGIRQLWRVTSIDGGGETVSILTQRQGGI